MFIQSDDNRNANTNIDLRNKVTVTPSIPFLSSSPLSSSSTSSSITLIGQNHNGSFTYSGMTNYSKFDNISSEHPNSSQKWSPDHQYNKSINSNRYSSNKYMRINQYYNMEESITNTIATTPSSSNESKIQIFKSIDNDGSISNTNQIGGICVNNNNSITTNTNNSNSNNIEIDIDLFRYPLREVMNQDLIDLLRSQISKLLEENEKLVSRIDDYRQKIAFIEREKREAAADPSNEVLTLQTELGEARMREAELTIAFEELQHRITAIDRLIETDPEMENFFNAVTISPTNLSLKKPSQTHSSSQNSSPAKYANTHQSPQHNLSDVEDQRMTHDIRSSPYLTDDNPQKVVSPSTNKTIYNRVTNNNNSGRIYSRLQNEAYAGNFNGDTDGEFPRNIQRSGLDSPQSDSGCSLASHTTFDGRDGIVTPASGRGTLAVGMENYDYNNNHGIGRRIAQQHYNPKRDRSRCVGGDDDEEMETESKSNRPRGFVSLLRRSRSSAADHAAMHGFRSELVSPSSNDYSRASIDTPTPTESCVSESEQNDAFTDDRRPGDRLSRLRASLRQSFGWPSSKPDFRMEAFAARQGEARALLKLRETRMDVLRVQSRCQTLQRHIDRLEAINSFRMSELEDAVANDRELRQEIRNLQTRIFQLEAE
ncbi:unnamed protein product [Heterobilharzia americana]|nr:unnamed protein product [Heterobilharzia americana]